MAVSKLALDILSCLPRVGGGAAPIPVADLQEEFRMKNRGDLLAIFGEIERETGVRIETFYPPRPEGSTGRAKMCCGVAPETWPRAKELSEAHLSD